MDRCNPSRNVCILQYRRKSGVLSENRILQNTKFVITKFYKTTGKKEQDESCELKLLEIHMHNREKDEPPTYSEKLAFVGIGVKHKTFE